MTTKKPAGGLTVTVMGKEFFLPRVEIPFEDLTLDPLNPRYAKPGGAYTLEELRVKLEKETKTRDLARSIMENGLTEPLTVSRYKKRCVVREGNRRYMAWEAIRKKLDKLIEAGESGVAEERAKYERVPCYEIPKGMDDRYVAAYLGIMHVQGKATWDNYAREVYLTRLVDMWGDERVIEMLGITKKKLTETKHTTQIAAAFSAATGVEDPAPHYAKLYEFGRLKAVRDDEEAQAAFFEAAKAGKFSDSVFVRQFPAIWKSEKARQVFMGSDPKEAYQKAMEVLKEEDPTAVKRSVFEMFSRLRDKLNADYRECLDMIAKEGPAREEYLASMRALICLGVRADLTDELEEFMK